MSWDDLSIEADINEMKDSDIQWQVTVKVKQKDLPKEKNCPYQFDIEVNGFYSTCVEFENKEAEREVIEVNGATMLYGIARETLRASTSRGPYKSMMLPTITFAKPERENLPVKTKRKLPSKVTKTLPGKSPKKKKAKISKKK